ncbi:Clp protease N-terminal domain-containing protein [Williamsia maris]|uniref:Clp amino terminal domain-containing protein, pathogenicity island component n=1 Tax=Williamsia maris TaxID=72806 RepID=A0ABT1HF89_9NOCA|nr:Clp protease N-terminal domain-containing protein [Williamsia maris]MCP2176829.1 Clp amino terminal domain-containing protein, pathogenicity island component [Williamsia maris]
MFEQFTRENRHILSFAMEEAADLGHTQLGNDHLILGMLCNARSPIFDRLTAEGFTLTAARETVRAVRGDAEDTDAEDADSSQVDEDREALKSVGIDLDKVATAIKNTFGTDITDGWSKRGSERRGRGDRGHGERGHRGGPDRGEDSGPRGHRGHRHGHGGPGFGNPEFGGPGFGGSPFGGPDFGDRRGGRGGFEPGDGPWEHGRGRRGPRGRGGPFGRPRFSVDAKAALANAVQIARETGSDRLTAEHVLLGILKTDDKRSRALIESVTTPDTLRDALSATA